MLQQLVAPSQVKSLQSIVLVQSLIDCCQLPRLLFCHQTTLWKCDISGSDAIPVIVPFCWKLWQQSVQWISSGVLAFFSFQNLAIISAVMVSELCTHSFLPTQYGHLLPFVLVDTLVKKTWGLPAGQFWHSHLALEIAVWLHYFAAYSAPITHTLRTPLHAFCAVIAISHLSKL